jgi:beta-lactamase regulating signal transducer with metallopeptidase domain
VLVVLASVLVVLVSVLASVLAMGQHSRGPNPERAQQ